MLTPSIRLEIGRSLAGLLAVLLVSLICGGCGTPQKASTASEREALKRASDEAYSKVSRHYYGFENGQQDRRAVERLLGKPNYTETKTVNGQKETLIKYWWKSYGPAPDFVDMRGAYGFELTFDAKGILRSHSFYMVIQ